MKSKLAKLFLLTIGLIFVWGFSGISGWGYDPGWHVHNGLNILQHGVVFHQDGFTWKAPNTPWANPEWGFDLLVGWIYSLFGWFGDRLLVVVVYALLFGVVLWHSRLKPLESGWIWIIFFFVASSAAAIRPQIISYLFFTIAIIGILRGWNLYLLSLMVIPWNNFHASAVLWLGLLAIETLVSPKKRSMWKPWFISLCGFIASPNGVGALLSFTKDQSNPLSLTVPEWMSPDFHGILPWILISLLVVSGYWVSQKGDLRAKLWITVGTSAFLYSQRFGFYALIIGVALLNEYYEIGGKIGSLISVGIFSIVLVMSPSLLNQPFAQPVELPAVQYLKSINATNILNQYEYGSTIEIEGLKPICDGRNIWLEHRWYENYFKTLIGKYPLAKLLKDDIPEARYAVFPLECVTTYQIQELPEWKEIYYDDKVGIWEKE